MNFNENNNTEESYIDFKQIIQTYLSKWKWYALSIFTLYTLSYIYVASSSRMYLVESTLLIKDDKKGGMMSEMSAFDDLGLGLSGTSSAIENEIEILKSRYLIEKVVKENSFNIKYYEKKGLRKVERLDNSPIKIKVFDTDFDRIKKQCKIEIDQINLEKFTIKCDKKIFNGIYGKKIKLPYIGYVTFLPNLEQENELNQIIITIDNNINTVQSFQGNLIIERINLESNAVKISLKTRNIDKGVIFVNDLIEQHRKDVVEDKNLVAKNTIIFINERIDFITKELSTVEDNVSEFKNSNNFFDLSENANISLENYSKNSTEIFENETQIKLSEYIFNDISDKDLFDLVPSNIGINNNSIEKIIVNVNSLILERNKILSNTSENNPIIINLDNQIKSLKENLYHSLKNLIKTLNIKNKELLNLNNKLNAKLDKAPLQEKSFREIQRQQTIKETLYLYLLQKREETSISYAVTVSNTKVIDEAFSNGRPTSPKSKLFFLGAIFLGVLIPTGLIYVSNLMDTKIKTKQAIIDQGIPYLGDIPMYENSDKIAVKQGDRSSTAEAFRMLKTNIGFMKSNDNDVKTIFITSTLSKEGKSFVSLNLASTYGLSGKRVLLIGLDLRAPKILEYLNINSNKGVSNYLVNDEVELNNYIIPLKNIENVSILPSGPIPPNPSELLNSDKIEQMFNYTKENYDIVIVDTAPVGLVTDTIQISKFADMFVYVVRANYLDKKMLQVGQTLYYENKLKNMAMILNGSDLVKGYGYGYGYGVEKEKVPFWKKPFTKS